MGPITAFDPSGFRSRLAGEVPGFSAKDFVPKHYRKAVKVMVRDTELAVGACLAAQDAGLRTKAMSEETATYPGERVGCQIGAGLIAAETEESAPAPASAVDESGRFQNLRRARRAETGAGGWRTSSRCGCSSTCRTCWRAM